MYLYVTKYSSHLKLRFHRIYRNILLESSKRIKRFQSIWNIAPQIYTFPTYEPYITEAQRFHVIVSRFWFSIWSHHLSISISNSKTSFNFIMCILPSLFMPASRHRPNKIQKKTKYWLWKLTTNKSIRTITTSSALISPIFIHNTFISIFTMINPIPSYWSFEKPSTTKLEKHPIEYS